MRAAAFTELGGPDGIEVIELDDPTPDSGEAVLRVEACALNHHDLWLLRGESSIGEGDLPFVSGVDVAGVVEAVGDNVDTVSPGDSVVLCPNLTCGTCRYCHEGPENQCADYGLYHGGLAAKASVNADRLIQLPDSVGVTEAAALPVAYMTAWHMLRRADATAGDLVFVPGATGGVGVAAVQLCDVIGARSIGTSTSRTKLSRLQDIGADHVFQGADPDELEQDIGQIGEVDVTLNHLGGEFTELGLSVLRRGGAMVACGRTAGARSEIAVRDLYWHHKRLIGSTMGTQHDLETLVRLVDDGRLDPAIGDEYDLDETADAFAAMQDRDAFGNLVVLPQR